MEGHEAQKYPASFNSIQDKYWLYRWIDDQGIRSLNDFYKAARRRNLVDVLNEYSASTTLTNNVPPRAVVPSAKLDLSGYMTCFHADCLLEQVQTLFSRTWHYFDTLVIDGPLIDDLNVGPSLFENLEQRVKLLLYLRKVGAEQHLAFNRKVQGICSQHFREYATEEGLGLDVLFDTAFEDEVVDRLSREASVHISKNWRGWGYSVRYGDLSGLMHALPHYDESAPPTDREILKDVFGRYCSALIADTSAARKLHLPLLQAGGTSLLSYSRPDTDPMDQVIALELRLPVIKNITLKDILHLREKHAAEFERFRRSLQKAMEEQLARTNTDPPEIVARKVVDEYVTPELRRIESELKVDQKALAKKIGANVTIAGTAVSVGALASVPLVIATGIAAIIPSFGPINKYFDDRGQIELSDYYFLWRTQMKTRKHR